VGLGQLDPDGWLQLALIVLALCFAAFASTAESAVRLVTRARVRRLIEQGLPKARAVDVFLVYFGGYTSAIVVLNALAILVASSLATLLAVRLFPAGGTPLWIAALLFAVLLVFSQMLPKAAAARDPERLALAVTGPLDVLTVLLAPLARAFYGAALLVLRLLGVRRGNSRLLVAQEELGMLGVGGEEGVLDEEEKEMIHGIVTMEDISAREIMTPRIDIAAVEAGSTVGDLVDVAIEQGYSRIPVYKENIDNILGIAYAKDLFSTLKAGKLNTPVTEIMRPAYFIPESKRVDELLHDMKEREIHLAIVVDEYGGTAGLVTIEDLLEEIVGEIRDEYDRGEEEKITEIAEGQAVFDGTVTVDDVNETLGLRLNSDEVDTIGGLVYDRLGKMPTPGDEVCLDEALITVLETDGRRIRRVKVSARKVQNGRRENGPERDPPAQSPG
jgi:putative hemolysin